MIPGSKGQKADASLLARGFLTPTSYKCVIISFTNVNIIIYIRSAYDSCN